MRILLTTQWQRIEPRLYFFVGSSRSSFILVLSQPAEFSCDFQMYCYGNFLETLPHRRRSVFYWQEVRIWWASDKDKGTTMALGQGYGGINWGLLSFWSLCFDCRGKKWTTLKLKRICNIPKICRVRDKYVIYLSFTKKVAPNMNGLGLEKAA